MRLAHIDDLDAIAAIEPPLELAGRNLFKLRLCRLLARRNAAELFIVDQLFDGCMLATDWAVRILAQFQLAKLHLPGIEQQQAVQEYFRRAENDLDRLVSLNRADDSRQHA